MKIGFGAPVSGIWANPDDLGRFAALAEDAGYDSLWTFHRLLVPADSESDPVYRSVLDPFAVLAFAAARTTRIRLGVSLINFPFVSPVYLAKQASSVDVLSGGRLDLGLGPGWSPLEFTAVGTTTERRGARLVEYVEVLRRLWAGDEEQFDGEFHTLPPARMRPLPVQQPGPPILLGGVVPAALQRVGRIADGWLTRSATDLEHISEPIAVVRQAAQEAGRDPDAMRVVVRGVVRHDPTGAGTPGPDGERLRLSGSYEQIREDAAWLGEQGVTDLFYDLNWNPLIGHPDVDPKAAAELAEEMLHALAPH